MSLDELSAAVQLGENYLRRMIRDDHDLPTGKMDLFDDYMRAHPPKAAGENSDRRRRRARESPRPRAAA